MPITPDEVAQTAIRYTAAWNSGYPDAVASFYAEQGVIVINDGEPYRGRTRVAEMAAGFYADVPNLNLTCDRVCTAGDHVAFHWTFTGHHAETRNPLQISGWEEWDIDHDGKVKASRGWFDSEDYAAQVAG